MRVVVSFIKILLLCFLMQLYSFVNIIHNISHTETNLCHRNIYFNKLYSPYYLYFYNR